MRIKLDDDIFEDAQVTNVSHVAEPTETTTLNFVGGGTLEFTGDAATAVWNWYVAKIELEL